MRKVKNLIIVFPLCLFTFCTNVQAYKYNAVSCGNVSNIPGKVPDLVSYGITLVQVAVPIILVIVSIIDLVKAISGQKEDEIKKGQQMIIKRIIIAILIFFVIALIKFVISVVANSQESDSIIKCIDCFVGGSDSCSR